MIVQVYRVKEKCTAKPAEGESTPQHKKKISHEHGFSEVWFLSYDLLNIEENHQSVNLELQCRKLHI
jgi:hypothetical protein